MKQDFPRLVARIRKEARGGKAVCFVSGGVDSSVAAVLAKKALGKRLRIFFIDNGFLRDREAERARALFKKAGLVVKKVKAGKQFFKALKKTRTSAERRNAYGRAVFSLVRKVAGKEGAKHVVLGSVREDLVVSGEKRVKGPRKVAGLCFIEPLADMNKKDVRRMAGKLGLKKVAASQHFPSPGLSVRVAGRLSRGRIGLVRRLTKVVEAEGGLAGLWRFPFLLEEKLDGRDCVVLRAVESETGLKAQPIADQKILRLAEKILESEPAVGRVFLDVTPKPPASIELM